MNPSIVVLALLLLLTGCATAPNEPSAITIVGAHWERVGGVAGEGLVPRELIIRAVDDRAVKSPAKQALRISPGDRTVDFVYTRNARFTDKLNRKEFAFGRVTFKAEAKEAYALKGDDYTSGSVVKVWVERLSDGLRVSAEIEAPRSTENIYWR
ncbi:MAG: hypothetical protein V4773_06410 [Verrucomicrobiota bacterium]